MKRDTLVAALWGFAEATLFFIVPDVPLSFILLRCGPLRALRAALAAAVAAMAGGAVMIVWASQGPDAAAQAVAAVPNISTAMMMEAHTAMAEDGLWAVLRGAFAGVPYKVYAVEAQAAGLQPLAFLVATVPVRLIRFAATLCVVAAGRVGLVQLGVPERSHTALLAVGWLVFYAWFFLVAPE